MVFTKLSFCQLAKLRGVFKNVTLFGPYVADYGRGVCVCPLSVGLCSDFGSLWVFTKLSFFQLRGVFKNVTLLGPYVADYGRGVCVCPLSVGLCSDFGSLWCSRSSPFVSWLS